MLPCCLAAKTLKKGGSVIGGGEWVAKRQTNKQVVFLTQNNIHSPSGEYYGDCQSNKLTWLMDMVRFIAPHAH